MTKLLGIDYGTKRVGVALSDDSGAMAFPRVVLENKASLLDALKEIIEQNEVKEIVVGKSVDYKMQPNVVMKEIDSFCDKLKEQTSLPIRLEPEFLTSHQAQYIQGKTDMLDASAAAIILQSYIDRN